MVLIVRTAPGPVKLNGRVRTEANGERVYSGGDFLCNNDYTIAIEEAP